MKTLQNWFDEYAVSHQNKLNKKIHYICVPIIYFTIVGLLFAIPFGLYQTGFPLLDNWAILILFFIILFYVRLSAFMALKMLLFSAICLIWNVYLSKHITLWKFDLALFIIAWIGQFYGHSIEGKKPSFLKDLQYLLIGPAWVMDNVFSKKDKKIGA